MTVTIKICGQALSILILSMGLAFSVNALRQQPLSLVMPFPPEYQCSSVPQSGVPVRVERALTMFGRSDVAFVDARPSPAFERGHIEHAGNIPYSFINPIGEETVRELKRFKAVIVYCNGKDAQVSATMAGELAQEGVQGVTYLEGGFLEWVKAGGRFLGERPAQYD